MLRIVPFKRMLFLPASMSFGRNPVLPGDLLTEPHMVVPCTAPLQDEAIAKPVLRELQPARRW